jgi:hypothetical protein
VLRSINADRCRSSSDWTLSVAMNSRPLVRRSETLIVRFAGVLQGLAFLLWAAAAICLGVLLLGDGGGSFLVGYVVFQGGAIALSALARRRGETP